MELGGGQRVHATRLQQHCGLTGDATEGEQGANSGHRSETAGAQAGAGSQVLEVSVQYTLLFFQGLASVLSFYLLHVCVHGWLLHGCCAVHALKEAPSDGATGVFLVI